MILPFTPLGELFKFERPPLLFFLILAGLVAAYLVLVEIVKRWFFRRFGNRLEQVVASRRRVTAKKT
jgi:Mg2+-importing ATPase